MDNRKIAKLLESIIGTYSKAYSSFSEKEESLDKDGTPQRIVYINFKNPTTFATIQGVYAYFGKFQLHNAHFISNGTVKDLTKFADTFTKIELKGKLTCEIVYKDTSPHFYSELDVPISGTLVTKDKIDNRENVKIKKPRVDKEIVKLLEEFCHLLDGNSKSPVRNHDSPVKKYTKTDRKTSKSKVIYTYTNVEYVRVLDKTRNKYKYVAYYE